MKTFRRALCLLIVSMLLTTSSWAGQYDTHIQAAVNYLQSQQLPDGSWQSPGSQLQFLETAEAVIALEAAYRREAAYFSGVTWLANHAANNVDYQARRAIALSGHNANTGPDITSIQLASRRQATGSNEAYGLSGIYEGAVWDTALALQGLAVSIVHTDEAIAGLVFLKRSQRATSPKGWSLTEGGDFDANTTAHVLLALAASRSRDSSLQPFITDGRATLIPYMSGSHPTRTKALALLAYLKSSATSTISNESKSSIYYLALAQNQNGSWGNSVYDTAMVLQALALAAQAEIASAKTAVEIPDAALRSAINQHLGRNAMDQLNRGELARLTTLQIANMGISDLTGLQYATNLNFLYASNNQITSATPILGLTKLHIADLGSNPCQNCDAIVVSTGDTPLPLWALGLLGTLLMGALGRFKRQH